MMFFYVYSRLTNDIRGNLPATACNRITYFVCSVTLLNADVMNSNQLSLMPYRESIGTIEQNAGSMTCLACTVS
jgi:hypothetical protein